MKSYHIDYFETDRAPGKPPRCVVQTTLNYNGVATIRDLDALKEAVRFCQSAVDDIESGRVQLVDFIEDAE